jgi:lipopolysaccharide heptosyltransferase II
MDRILVVLPNWYGETLFAAPFLRALRRARSDAFIATLGRPLCREVLLHSPWLNDLLDYDETGHHAGLLGRWRLIRQVRRHRFDAAFILRRSLSRTLLLAAAGIPVRVGHANRKSGCLLTHQAPLDTTQHKASTYLPLLGAVGLRATDGPYEYFVTEEERRRARAWLADAGLSNQRALVILHPGANWPHKRWPAERFGGLGERLADGAQAQIVITGGPRDEALVQAVRGAIREPSWSWAGQGGLRDLAALLEQADLVVSNDTGILHVAAALRRPVVGLYGPTSPALTGPLGDPARTIVLHHPDCCPRVPCREPSRPQHPGMGSISVDEAFTAAQQLLEEARGRGARAAP